MGAAALSDAYYPREDQARACSLTNAALGLAGRAVPAVVQESLRGV